MRALQSYHPLIAMSYFAAMVLLCFVSAEPVYRLLGFLSAVVMGIAWVGWRGFAKTAAVLVLLAAAVGAFNMLFNANGLTVLVTLRWPLGITPLTVEALCYGLCLGLMLSSVLAWFCLYDQVMRQHDVLMLLGRITPTVALIVARVTVFVPELVAHARQLSEAERALGRKHPPLAWGVRLSTQLMEWGMERSLITADSMRARGYGTRARSNYCERLLTGRDRGVLATLAVLVTASLVLQVVAGAQFSFYPRLGSLSYWWNYLPYLLLCVLPLFLQLAEACAWQLSRGDGAVAPWQLSRSDGAVSQRQPSRSSSALVRWHTTKE